MPRPTHSEIIRQTELAVASLNARMDHVREDLLRLEARLQQVNNAVNDLQARLSVVERELANMRAQVKEFDQKQWQVWLVFVGSLLALLGVAVHPSPLVGEGLGVRGRFSVHLSPHPYPLPQGEREQ